MFSFVSSGFVQFFPESDEENTSEAESYVSDETDSDEYSDEESDDGQVCLWTEKLPES